MGDHLNGLSETNRQAILEKKRQAMLNAFEQQKKQIEKDNAIKLGSDKFVAEGDSLEASLKRSTVGLVELEDFKRIKNEIENGAKGVDLRNKKKKKKKRDRMVNTLSFSLEDEEAEEVLQQEKKKKQDSSEQSIKSAQFGKDPTIDTSFLPDKEREDQERRLRVKYSEEWLELQKKIKLEKIMIPFTFWDGFGHVYEVECQKGDSLKHFLERCKSVVRELKTIATDHLLVIKDDLILPHHATFYDFILRKAQGKAKHGPLFKFENSKQAALSGEAAIANSESRMIKVVQRSWYEKHQHIFPASRWRPFDPDLDYDLKEEKSNINTIYELI